MGKAEEIWDDSALISAFDNAISTYKKMHGRRSRSSSKDHSTDGGDAEIITHQSNGEAIRDGNEESNVASNAAKDPEEVKNLIPTQDNHHSGSVGPVNSSIGQQEQAANEHSYAQNVESYHQLLSQYYEIEENRQRILQQLQQFGSYSYNYPSDGVDSSQQWTAYCTSQDLSFSTIQPACCPCACPCSAFPCSSFSACSFGATCADKTRDNSSGAMASASSVSHVDGDIVKVAMGAAERAISFTKTILLGNSSPKEKGNGKDNEEEMAQSTKSETDLSVVLNAWYSAGFYTGKYLTEQSTMKKLEAE